MVFSNHLMDALQGQIVGQDYAVTALTRAVTLALAGRRHSRRPLAVLLFVGPSGSGKTHVAQSLARVLHGHERKLISVNCSQLAQSADPLNNLGEQLTVGHWLANATLPDQPSAFSILVIEKVDKVPATFRDYLAAAIDRGQLYAAGQLFSLRNAFIILTSDLAKRQTEQLIGRTIGFFRDGENEFESSRQHTLALEEMDHLLGAYLVNHIDEIILFESLSEQKIVTLLKQQLAELEEYLAGLSIGLMIDETAETFLLKHSLEDLTHGMRQISRVVRNHLEFPLADLVFSRRLMPGTTVLVKHEAPHSYLHFHLMVPRFASAHWPVMRLHQARWH
jgi:ATP-dependent Clp protease ATP-binding subunit ClpC